MRPKKISYTPADDDTDGFANDQTGATCILAATSAGDGMAHLVIITNNSAVDHSDNGETFTLTGTDADGYAQTEIITGPGASVTTTSTKYFKTLTSVVPSITWDTDTYDVGWTDDILSPTYPLNTYQRNFSVGLGVDIAGTIDFTLQYTLQRMQSAAPATFSWWPLAALTAKTADTTANLTVPSTGVRLLINSLTAGATIALLVTQSD
jgi:hypothetical protein